MRPRRPRAASPTRSRRPRPARAPYSLAATHRRPPLADETDCNQPSTRHSDVTVPPWRPYTSTLGTTTGGIPAPDLCSLGNFSNYTSPRLHRQLPRLSGRAAVERLSVSSGVLNTDLEPGRLGQLGRVPEPELPGRRLLRDQGLLDGQGSYLAGAITEAQYRARAAAAQRARSTATVISGDERDHHPERW